MEMIGFLILFPLVVAALLLIFRQNKVRNAIVWVAVSYTHLDVYKRQLSLNPMRAILHVAKWGRAVCLIRN